MSVAHDTQTDVSTTRAMLALALGMLAVILIPEVAHPGFYYADDVRHYFMPHVMDIGSRLDQGELPWITLRSWFSGNYVGDGLLSMFNPINMALYWLCAQIGDPALAALIFAGTYLYLTALGVYFLARAYSTPKRWAVIAALAYCSSAYVMYWHAATWWNALVGTCWMIWAWLGWRHFIREQRCGFIAFLSTFFLLISGWPQGVIMAVLIVLVELWFARDRFFHMPQESAKASDGILRWRALNIRRVFAVLTIAACAAGASLISNFPAYIHATESARSSWGVVRGPTWVGSLDNVIAAGWPSYMGSSAAFFGVEPSLPIYYLAWFVPPALFMMIKRDIWLSCSPRVLALLVIATIATLLSLGPEQSFMLRWPLRFLTFAHVAVVIAACYVMNEVDLKRRTDAVVWFTYAAIGAIVSTLVDPQAWLVHAAFLALIALMVKVSASRDASAPRLPLVVGLFLLSIHLCFHFLWPRNGNVGDWPVPNHGYVPTPESFSADNRVVLISAARPCKDGKCSLASGNIGMWEPGRALNGYSPVGQRPYHAALGFNLWSWTERRTAVAAYFATDQYTGKPLYELMRISEFRVSDDLLEQFNMAKQGEWQSEPIFGGMLFRKKTEAGALPGTISWLTAGMQLDSCAEATSTRETLTLLKSDPTAESGRIVFARAWYPGYSAHIDGRPLEVEKYGDYLVSVLIPANSSGTIELRYRPVGFGWTMPLAVGCAALAFLISLLSRHRARLTEDNEHAEQMLDKRLVAHSRKYRRRQSDISVDS